MSEPRGAIASKVCAAIMAAGGFVVLAAAFPVRAATDASIPGDGPGILVLLMVVAMATMAAILTTLLRRRAPNPAPIKRRR